MPIECIGASSASVVNSASVSITTPDGVEDGDLLLFAFVLGGDAAHDATNFFSALTLPAGWSHAGYTSTTTNRIVLAYKYASSEPATTTFTYLSALNWVGQLLAYRGVARSFVTFVPVYTPPLEQLPAPSTYVTPGFFAPLGSVGAALTGTSQTLSSVSGNFPTTVGVRSVEVYLFAQFNAAGNVIPELDDPSPLVSIRQRSSAAGAPINKAVSLMVADNTYVSASHPTSAVSVRSSVSLPYVVASIALEPATSDVVAAVDALNTYKGKVLRSLMPPPYDTRTVSDLGKLLSVIGAGDNDLCGLFGSEDFLAGEP